jgi:hypothetical protein
MGCYGITSIAMFIEMEITAHEIDPFMCYRWTNDAFPASMPKQVFELIMGCLLYALSYVAWTVVTVWRFKFLFQPFACNKESDISLCRCD